MEKQSKNNISDHKDYLAYHEQVENRILEIDSLLKQIEKIVEEHENQ